MCSFIADAKIAFPCAIGVILKPAGDANRDLVEPLQGIAEDDARAFAARMRFDEIQGEHHTKFCDAWTGYWIKSTRLVSREAGHARNTGLASKPSRAYTPVKSSAR